MFWKWVLVIVSAMIGVFAMVAIVMFGAPLLKKANANYLAALDTYMEVTDIGQYGEDESPELWERRTEGYFPESIQPNYIEPHFRYYRSLLAGYEIYLEFRVADQNQLDACLQKALKGNQWVEGEFYFDKTYREYTFVDSKRGVICDYLQLDDEMGIAAGKTVYKIADANIKKILVNWDEKRIIFLVINGMGDGNTTEEIHSFFDRFQIDPKEYEAYLQLMREKDFGN